MTLHRGDPVLYRGERHMVKDVISPTWPVLEDEDGFAFAVAADAVQPIVRVAYTPVRPCFICDKREGTLTVSFEGTLADCCETCYERGTEAVIRDEGDDDA